MSFFNSCLLFLRRAGLAVFLVTCLVCIVIQLMGGPKGFEEKDGKYYRIYSDGGLETPKAVHDPLKANHELRGTIIIVSGVICALSNWILLLQGIKGDVIRP